MGLLVSCVGAQPATSTRSNEAAGRGGAAAKTMNVLAVVDAERVLGKLSKTAFTLNLTSDHVTNFSERSVELWRGLGVKTLRWPGGSDADRYDFTLAPDGGHRSTGDFARLAESVGADAFITLNFGSGSPQMAAAFAAYLNGSPSDARVLGVGKRPKDGGKSWVDFDWKSVGYWARLRGEAPLAKDDGLNHLRVSHAAPWGFKYFELGNEVMASWENDARPPGQKQSPLAYAAFCKQAAELLHAVDPRIEVGIVVVASEDVSWRNGESAEYEPVKNPATGKEHAGWNALLLSELKRIGYTPDFLIDHFYPQPDGRENDQHLLSLIGPTSSERDSNGALSWAGRAADYRRMLTEYLGAEGDKVGIRNTEHNSVSSNPGKQSTSLVNALFYADSFGAVTRTEIGGFAWWLARSSATKGKLGDSLYGWREYGDYGLVGEDGYVYFGDGKPLPGRTAYVPYPSYFAAMLSSMFASPGDAVLDVTSVEPLVSVYAARTAAGLSVLVINKSPDAAAQVSFTLEHFAPTSGKQYQYGKAQDDAQSKGESVDLAEETLGIAGAEFSREFPPYSLSLLRLAQ